MLHLKTINHNNIWDIVAVLREKYDLHMVVERYISDEHKADEGLLLSYNCSNSDDTVA